MIKNSRIVSESQTLHSEGSLLKKRNLNAIAPYPNKGTPRGGDYVFTVVTLEQHNIAEPII